METWAPVSTLLISLYVNLATKKQLQGNDLLGNFQSSQFAQDCPGFTTDCFSSRNPCFQLKTPLSDCSSIFPPGSQSLSSSLDQKIPGMIAPAEGMSKHVTSCMARASTRQERPDYKLQAIPCPPGMGSLVSKVGFHLQICDNSTSLYSHTSDFRTVELKGDPVSLFHIYLNIFIYLFDCIGVLVAAFRIFHCHMPTACGIPVP